MKMFLLIFFFLTDYLFFSPGLTSGMCWLALLSQVLLNMSYDMAAHLLCARL